MSLPAVTPTPAPVATAPQQLSLALPAATPASPASPASAVDTALPASNLDLARRSQEVPAPAAATVPAADPAPRRDFAAAFGDLTLPAEEQRSTVDLAALEKARAKRLAQADERGPLPDAPKDTKRTVASEPPASTAAKKGAEAKTAKGKDAAKTDPKAKAKPAAPSHPSRIWVQVGVGRNKEALGFDWRKFQRTEAALFKGKKPWTTPWVQTNRLLVGPFDTQAGAQAFLKELKKNQIDAFIWTSPAGQAVDALAVK